MINIQKKRGVAQGVAPLFFWMLGMSISWKVMKRRTKQLQMDSQK